MNGLLADARLPVTVSEVVIVSPARTGRGGRADGPGSVAEPGPSGGEGGGQAVGTGAGGVGAGVQPSTGMRIQSTG